MRESTFDAGVTIHYAEGPDSGPPLVMLHGGSARWQSFENLIPELTQRWHLYAPDLRGHGRSGRTPKRYRLRDYADDVVAFLGRVVGKPVYLFGHSLGGIVALLVAARYTQPLGAVAVGDAPLTGETWRQVIHESRDKLLEWSKLAGGQVRLAELVEALKNSPVEKPGQAELVSMRKLYGDDHPVFDWLAANLYQADPDTLTALTDDFENTVAGYDMDQLMPSISCPVLLLQADPRAGGLMTDAEIDRARHLLPRSEHVRLAGVGHALHHVHKDPVLKALITFFEAL